MILVFRQHKDDPDMIEIIQRLKVRHGVRTLAWAIVHSDMIDDEGIKDCIKRSGEADVVIELRKDEAR